MNDDDEPKHLDTDKVAAAAGGAYDADEDPLNAPNVLAAVKEFRRKLDKTHGNQKTLFVKNNESIRYGSVFSVRVILVNASKVVIPD